MSNFDINVDRRTDKRTEKRMPLSQSQKVRESFMQGLMVVVDD